MNSLQKIVIIQSSLNENSTTAHLTSKTYHILKEKANCLTIEILDLREIELQFCDGRDLMKYNSDLQKVYTLLSDADGFIIGMPVYRYSLSGVLKNFLDIVGRSMENKVVGILENCGTIRSYLASVDLIKILSYDLESIVVHPVVQTIEGDFSNEGEIINIQVIEKINQMCNIILGLINKNSNTEVFKMLN